VMTTTTAQMVGALRSDGTGQIRIRYNDAQAHQVEAIQAVIDLFQDIPHQDTGFMTGAGAVVNLPGQSLVDYQDEIDQRFTDVQLANRTGGGGMFRTVDYTMSSGLEGMLARPVEVPHFSVEMETGTGKTYVYLRTIYALRQQNGFGKFVIVVPSVAIYEGVKSAFQSMQAHLAGLYGNETTNLIEFDSDNLSCLRAFETTQTCDILLMTIDSFNKKNNRVYRPTDKLPGGRLPIHYIQSVQPIVILDEPQNMESQLAQSAIHTLNPLCVLRYSATHRNAVNVVYQLRPFDALRRGLVKQVHVLGVVNGAALNNPRPFLVDVRQEGRRMVSAGVNVPYLIDGEMSRRVIEVKLNDDLYTKSGRFEELRHGWNVVDFGRDEQGKFIRFANGEILRSGGSADPAVREALFRQQIRETLESHVRRQHALKHQGIKVLSLFFVDRVASYRGDQAIVRTLFAEEFMRIRARVAEWRDLTAEDVSAAYFSKDKQGRDVDVDKQEDLKEEYRLIMRDKERMLSFAERKCVIFAHSALKEGWDNPNVFQICTLRETQSEMRKRQEIGRGLRICVNQDGERVFGDEINILTVVANASYEEFVRDLQTELHEDGVIDPPPPPVDATKARIARRSLSADEEQHLRAFWQKAARRVTAQLHVDEEQLVQEGISRLNRTEFPEVTIDRTQGKFMMMRLRATLREVDGYGATFELERHASRVDADATEVRRITLNKSLAGQVVDAPELRQRVIKQIDMAQQKVHLSTKEVVRVGESLELFQRGIVKTSTEQAQQVVEIRYPIIDFPKRVGDELQLSRRMVERLFTGLSVDRQEVFLRNPEGFTNRFIDTMRDVIRAHVVQRVTFVAHDDVMASMDELLAPEMQAAQREVIATHQRALYVQTQYDSNEELKFIRQLEENGDVVLFFKFPPKYKLDFPEIIGNYNPDWGVIRRPVHGQTQMYLVRETKGTAELEKLRFSREKYVILTAYRCFKELNLDYRVVVGDDFDWWLSKQDAGIQRAFLGD